MKQPIGLEQMKQKYLSNIGIKSICNQKINIDNDQECFNEKQKIETWKSNMITNSQSLLNLFDTVTEPLFRSNIVFYSTIGFCSFVILTFIYDRFYIS
ncbi:unnamed protein product, partial [Rotaria sp. Silwood1]